MNILGLDVGEKRIGMALANVIARLPSPHGVIANNDDSVDTIKKIIAENDVKHLVIGLPRNQSGQETAQSKYARDFALKLNEIELPITFSDESLSSKRAEELQKNSKNRSVNQPIDDLAACFILEEFFLEEKNR